MCNISGQPGVVILLRRERGITMTGCEVISRESPFLQTLTHVGWGVGQDPRMAQVGK
jgi:hypothetical protein